ncbi:uncharacterized protein KGF55_004370 [Candida pseudojiufengensis]|uniref:uncharacterized protein n=1 Tax=Candida pseudojiufengensis TaxID=497109 RepID=UPI0022247B87|nr:uncharacterized protein KGF55_004370 [Candida pseudojiufengensis]KAI5960800.1 hypothetical protein KGF55_004370 [Candida pseudojiufengensis]
MNSPCTTPQVIRRLFELYSVLSTHHTSSYANKYISTYLQNTSDSSLRNSRWSILNKNRDPKRFGKHSRDRDQLLCSNPIQFGINEMLDTKSLFRTKNQFHTSKENLISKYPKGRKNDNVYINDLKSLIEASFNPKKSIPLVQGLRQTFKYYIQRLNSNTNTMIIFKQNQRLFSSSALDNWNQSYLELKTYINKLNLENDVKNKENFEFSKVVHPDILNLALKSHQLFQETNNVDRKIDQVSWKIIDETPNDLAGRIIDNQKFTLIEQNKVIDMNQNTGKLKLEIGDVFDLYNKFGSHDMQFLLQDFDYDLLYNQFFMLNILNNTKVDEKKLLQTLEVKLPDFELIGIKSNKSIEVGLK